MNHIKQLRIKSNFKTANLAAEALGISRSMMKKIECGRKRPSIDLGFEMTKVFNCTLDDIFLPYKSLKVNTIESKGA